VIHSVFLRLPQHPCMRLVAHTQQALTGGFYRRCITVEKVKAWSAELKVKRRDKAKEPEPAYANVKEKVFMSKSDKEALYEKKEDYKDDQEPTTKKRKLEGADEKR